MTTTLVQYRVKAEHADANQAAIRTFFAELEQSHPHGLRYSSFVREDGRSFVHLVSVDSPEGKHPFRELASFQAFSSALKDRCEQMPVFEKLEAVGAYRAGE